MNTESLQEFERQWHRCEGAHERQRVAAAESTWLREKVMAVSRLYTTLRTMPVDIDADDLSQETHKEIDRKIRSGHVSYDSGRGHFGSLWTCIVYNTVEEFLAKVNRKTAWSGANRVDFDLQQCACDSSDDQATKEFVRELLERLPDGQREVMVLRYLAGWAVGEIAAFLGIEPGSVTKRLERAKEALRIAFPEETA